MLLATAWIADTSPFQAPDEASHFVRAIGLENGHLLGQQIPYLPNPGLNPVQEAFIDHDTRAVSVPADLMPGNMLCIDGQLNRSGCIVATPSGNFPPLGYVLPAATLGFFHSATSALWAARVASALQSLAFLLLAIALLWEGTGWSLLGLLAAISPMVLFCAAILNPSGIEIASCLAFAAAGLRIARDPRRISTRLWAAFAVAGAVAALTGPIDVIFVVADLVVFAGVLGVPRLRELARARTARIATGVVAGALVLAYAYTRAAGFASNFGLAPFGKSLQHGLDQLPPVLGDAVGDFASQTVPLPGIVHWFWWLLAAGVIALALWLGDRRERTVVAVVTVLGLAFPILFWAWVDRYSGFGLQGREVLPELMLIPLVAGEVVARHRARLQRRAGWSLALAGTLAVVGGVQLYAWWLSARAASGSSAVPGFWSHAAWSPLLGWAPWLVLAALGAIALVSFALGEAVGRAAPPSSAHGGRAAPIAGSRSVLARP